MSETALDPERPNERGPDRDPERGDAGPSHDAEDRLNPDFGSEVIHRVDEGDAEGARELVAPLHPADISAGQSESDSTSTRTIDQSREAGPSRGRGQLPRGVGNASRGPTNGDTMSKATP